MPSPEIVTAVGGVLVGVFSSIIAFMTFRNTAKKDALDFANRQIELQDARIERLEGRLNEKDTQIDELKKRVGDLESERNVLKTILDVALRYIKRLRTIMEECQIAVPPMPDELIEHS